MNDLMIDFETLGQTPDTIVISLGACFFDPMNNKIGPTFYMAFEVEDQIKKGRSITADTLKWWMGQSGAAKKVFNEKAKLPKEVLETFSQWVLANSSIKNVTPWGNGASFDISIIEDLFRDYDVKCPWLFYNVMDLRTFRKYVANNAKVEKLGTNHNALDDAVSQATFVNKHYQVLRELERLAEWAVNNQNSKPVQEPTP